MTDPASTALTAPRLALGAGAADYDAAVERARADEWANRLFARDVRLWSSDPRVGEAIAERLGWLDAPAHFAERIAGLEGFGDAVVDEGYTTVVVAGMGGSSLAPDVLASDVRQPRGLPRPAHPRLDRPGLRVGDARRPRSAPDARHHRLQVGHDDRAERVPRLRLGSAPRRRSTPSRTMRYETAGAYFAAITDPGKSAEAIAHHDDFREVFTQPAGHRRPLLGADLRRPRARRRSSGSTSTPLLASASAMLGACREPDPAINPGVSLGLAIGTLAKAGRDKLTFLADDEIASFGAWVEQLIAESTGKHGVGIVPVDLEPLGAVEAYGPDRAFVRLALAGRAGGGRATPSPRRSRRPATRSSGSSSPTRSTSAPSSSAGRSRPRSPGRSWASTRSTSPTSRRPSS